MHGSEATSLTGCLIVYALELINYRLIAIDRLGSTNLYQVVNNIKEPIVKKFLSTLVFTLIAGLFAVAVFAADVSTPEPVGAAPTGEIKQRG